MAQGHGDTMSLARSLARWRARARRALRAASAITTVPRVPPPPAPQHPDALPPPRIRRADAVDLDALVALEERAFSHDRLSRAQFRRHLDSDSALVLIAKEDGRLLGVAVVFFRRGARVARLYSLVTAPEARGRGVGAALLEAAERAARVRRCRSLRLEVRTDNRTALRLYETRGYHHLVHRPGYYEDGSDAHRYEKPLR